MLFLDLEIPLEQHDLLIAELYDAGSTGIVESDLDSFRVHLRAFFDADSADALAARFAAYSPRIEEQPDRDWVAESRRSWQPFSVGGRFFLVPEWLDDPAPEGRVRIAINPGLACGSGVHEATQLCLEALEHRVRPHMTVVDIGCGAGILSIAASLLGARRTVACDTDPVAIGIAASNFRRAGAGVLLFTGSAEAITTAGADLIVANISAATSIALAPELLRCLSPAGTCVLSGFEQGELPAVESALQTLDAAIEQTSEKGSWRALEIRRRNSS